MQIGGVMWLYIADLILRYRIGLLVVTVLLTGVLGYIGFTRVEVTQSFIKVIPRHDPDLQDFRRFEKTFGTDGDAFIVAFEGGTWFTPAFLNSLKALTDTLETFKGVKRVLNVTHASRLVADDSTEQFRFVPLMPNPLETQAEADSLRARVDHLPIYENLLFDTARKVCLTAITVENWMLKHRQKHILADQIRDVVEPFRERHDLTVHYAGLLFIRNYITKHMPREMALFAGLALLLTAISLYAFYRSFYAMVFPLVLLIISTIWTLGLVGVLGYKITLLTGMLPPIIIILGIPPSIYMLSDYHEEYIKVGDKIEALRLMIRKMGLVTLMINANTAFGFLTLYFTEVVVLQEFGLLAFLSTMAAYFITLILLPGFYSLMPPPSEQHLSHLEAPRINAIVRKIDGWTHNRKTWIYTGSFVLLFVALWGISKLRAVSYMVDDLPTRDHIYTDLKFMEQKFNGVMPFEIVVDFGRKEGVRKHRNLQKIAELQDRLQQYDEISRTLSLVDGLKWSRQALFGGQASEFMLPARAEMDFIALYTQGMDTDRGQAGEGQRSLLSSLVDSTYRKARISGFVQDVGSNRMRALLAQLEQETQEVFGTGEKAPEVILTGTTRIFLKANQYLIENLAWSLLAAFLIIGLQMYVLFGSWRIMVVSMIPNLLPLVVTAGLMGFISIPVKPSTALIYEMAFGIAIDHSIHYLAAYRFRRREGQDIGRAVSTSMRNTGMSIIYTSVVLFMGFAIFALSAFGSTRALGVLTSVTLFIAMFSNLLLMPALLLDMDRESDTLDRALIDEDS